MRIYVDPAALIDTVVEKIETFVISSENVKIKSDGDGHRIDMRCCINDEKGSIFSQYDRVRKINGVNQIEITKNIRGYCKSAKSTPAATAEPITPETLAPMACMIRWF